MEGGRGHIINPELKPLLGGGCSIKRLREAKVIPEAAPKPAGGSQSQGCERVNPCLST